MANIKYYILVVLATIAITGCGVDNYNQTERVVHISIDDVHLSLMDICENGDKYESIFEQKFFKMLKYYNNKQGAKFTLYLYEKVGNWSISDLPLKFKEELSNSAEWLKFGFHSRVMGNPADRDNPLSQFTASYNNVNCAIENFSSKDNISNILRLEYFFATDSIRKFLAEEQITLLSADSEGRVSYALPQDICDSIYIKGGYTYENQKFYKTDFRIENMDILNIDRALSVEDLDTLFIFTHEFALDYKNRYKLYMVMNSLDRDKYRYIN